MTPTVLALAGRFLGGDETGEAHKCPGSGKAAPVENLGRQTQRSDAGDPPIGSETAHLVTEG